MKKFEEIITKLKEKKFSCIYRDYIITSVNQVLKKYTSYRKCIEESFFIHFKDHFFNHPTIGHDYVLITYLPESEKFFLHDINYEKFTNEEKLEKLEEKLKEFFLHHEKRRG